MLDRVGEALQKSIEFHEHGIVVIAESVSGL